tara:strand:- start:2431 stop:2643 length:213 start_codon:yes stop_codon:yes gene_type:complete
LTQRTSDVSYRDGNKVEYAARLKITFTIVESDIDIICAIKISVSESLKCIGNPPDQHSWAAMSRVAFATE